MNRLIFIILISIFLTFSCERKENAIDTEKEVFKSVFNQTIDSIYWKLDSAKVFKKNNSKTIIVSDSIYALGAPNPIQISRHFKHIKQVYVDSGFDKYEYKIDPKILMNKKNFICKYRSEIPESIDTMSMKKYAIPGVLTFTKMHFDKNLNVGIFGCTYGNGNLYTSKEFFIYVERNDDNWKINKVQLRNLVY